MKIELVFPHLENCNGQLATDRLPVPTFTQLSTLQSEQKSFPKPSPKIGRLAHLNYSLLRETALRKKLVELGIPSVGSRQQLERRHIEWVTLWNANCDSSKPRKKSELLNELDVWEKTQGMRAPSSSSNLNTGSQVLGKDFDGAGWAAKHGQTFRDLIATARRGVGKKEPPKSPESEHNMIEGSEVRSSVMDPVDSEQVVKDQPKIPAPDTLRSCGETSTTKHLPLERTLDSRKDERLFRGGGDSLILPASSQNSHSPNKFWREDENSITGDSGITTRSEAL
jgi:E3 ubiquitin-protein ligase RAD18